jgi:hypothetical protein
MSGRCADLSRTAEEPLAATATTAERWLLLEVRGGWARDVGDAGALPPAAQSAVAGWLAASPRSRLQFIRRPGRDGEPLLAFVVRSEEGAAEVRRVELDEHAQLADVDLDSCGGAVDGSLLLVCGHGSRDRCCALYGTPVFTTLAERLSEEELWISSHQGGHRFAPNLLVLPVGLQFGRVPADDAALLAARALAGRIDLDRYRGRTCYVGRVQAAEIAVRRAAGLEGVAEVRLEAVADSTVTLRTWDGGEWAVVVDELDGPSVPASCGAEPEPQRHFRAASVTRAVSAGADTRDR